MHAGRGNETHPVTCRRRQEICPRCCDRANHEGQETAAIRAAQDGDYRCRQAPFQTGRSDDQAARGRLGRAGLLAERRRRYVFANLCRMSADVLLSLHAVSVHVLLESSRPCGIYAMLYCIDVNAKETMVNNTCSYCPVGPMAGRQRRGPLAGLIHPPQ